VGGRAGPGSSASGPRRAPCQPIKTAADRAHNCSPALPTCFQLSHELVALIAKKQERSGKFRKKRRPDRCARKRRPRRAFPLCSARWRLVRPGCLATAAMKRAAGALKRGFTAMQPLSAQQHCNELSSATRRGCLPASRPRRSAGCQIGQVASLTQASINHAEVFTPPDRPMVLARRKGRIPPSD
jgi:hypothetical protein